MRLPEFILANVGPTLADWDTFARSLAPGTKLTKLALREMPSSAFGQPRGTRRWTRAWLNRRESP